VCVKQTDICLCVRCSCLVISALYATVSSLAMVSCLLFLIVHQLCIVGICSAVLDVLTLPHVSSAVVCVMIVYNS